MARSIEENKLTMMKQADALSSWLDKNHWGEWTRHDGTFESIQWREGITPPAESDYLAVKDSLENDKRVALLREYPGLGQQLDLLWHDIDSNETLKTQFSSFYNAIKAVKDDVPK